MAKGVSKGSMSKENVPTTQCVHFFVRNHVLFDVLVLESETPLAATKSARSTYQPLFHFAGTTALLQMFLKHLKTIKKMVFKVNLRNPILGRLLTIPLGSEGGALLWKRPNLPSIDEKRDSISNFDSNYGFVVHI